nr:replication-associated protein A [Ipomoea batatas]
MPRQPRARSVFSFSSKYGFLTYSQCDLTAEIIQQMLITLLTPFNLLFLAVAPEHHQDGSLHFHVLFQCARRIITRRVDFFDLNNYHPNIQPARDSAAVLEYISKEQPPIVWGEFQNHKVSPSRRDDRWRDIIFTSTSKAEYLNRVKQEFPADYATRLQQLEYSAERLFPTTAPPYVSPFDPLTLQCHEDIQDWINRELYLDCCRVTSRLYVWMVIIKIKEIDPTSDNPTSTLKENVKMEGTILMMFRSNSEKEKIKRCEESDKHLLNDLSCEITLRVGEKTIF